MVVFWQDGCIREKNCSIRAKVVVFEQKWFYSGKIGCIGGKRGCIWAKLFYSDKSGCNRAKVVVFRTKVVVFR